MFLRYAILIVLGSAGGLVWYEVFVDFPPAWVERLPVAVSLVMFVWPVLAHFFSGLLITWWRLPHACAYAAVVFAWWIVGDIRNELANVGDLSHFGGIIDQGVLYVGVYAVLLGSWMLARRLRKLPIYRRGAS